MATRNANQDAAVALVRRQNASVTPANISRALQALAADPKLLASIMQQTPRDPASNMIVDPSWRPGNKGYDDFWSRVDPSFATQSPQGGASSAAAPAAAATPAGGERTLDDIINELLAGKNVAATGEEAAEPPATEVAEPPAAEAAEGHDDPKAAAAASPMPASSDDNMLMELLLGGVGAGAAAYGASRMQALIGRLRSLPSAQQRMLLTQIRGGM